MPLTPTVAPGATIATSTYGNPMRDRTIQQATDAGDFAGIAAAAAVNTWVCKLYDGGSLWQKQAAGMVEMIGATRTFAPSRYEGNVTLNSVTAIDYCEYQRSNGWVTYAGQYHYTSGSISASDIIYVDVPYPAVRANITIGSFVAYDPTQNRNYGGAGFIAGNGGLAGMQPPDGYVGQAGSGVFDEHHGGGDTVHWTVRYRTATLT